MGVERGRRCARGRKTVIKRSKSVRHTHVITVAGETSPTLDDTVIVREWIMYSLEEGKDREQVSWRK